MGKIDRFDLCMSKIDERMCDKLDELVEGHNEMKANLKAVSYYNELDRRLKRLEIIEVKRMLDNK